MVAHYVGSFLFLSTLIGAPVMMAMEVRSARYKIAAALANRGGRHG